MAENMKNVTDSFLSLEDALEVTNMHATSPAEVNATEYRQRDAGLHSGFKGRFVKQKIHREIRDRVSSLGAQCTRRESKLRRALTEITVCLVY